MSLLPSIKDLKKSPATTVKTKIFSAKVVDNNDPAKLQRVKFRIKKIHRGVVDADLPWALPLSTNLQGNNSVGTLNIPVLGSSILVEYLDDYTPVYKGVLNQDTNKLSELVNTHYPNCYGFIDRSGNKLFVDTQADTVDFIHLSGTQLHISQNGDVSLKTAQALNLEGNTLNVKTTGATTFSCSSFTVNSTSIALKSTGALLLEAASLTLSSAAAVVLNAATFALNAAFNWTPTNGWSAQGSASPGSSTASITPPTAPTARTKPTVTAFTNQTDY